MKRPFISIIAISVLMVSIFVGIMDFTPSSSGETGPPNDSGLGMDVTLGDNIWTTNGTWTIVSGDNIIHSNKTIIVNGDLQINGTLTLINVTLQMDNAAYDGQFNITVYDAGNLLITDLDDDHSTTADASVIESANAFRFGFQAIPGAQFELKNSELYDCGWSTSPFVDGFGLFINTDWANVTGNYITNAYRGVIIWESDNVTIANNTIDSTEYMGIYTNGAVDCDIQYNTITNIPNYGVYLYSSLFLNVSFNNIIDNPLYGISLDGGGGYDIYNNLIDNNDLGIFITADGSSYSTSYCYIFENEISNNTKGIHIQGYDGTSAVQFIYIYDNQIHSNSENAIYVLGDNGPFAVNNLYIFGNEIFDNIDTFGGHAVQFFSNELFGDVGIIFCNNNVIRDNSFSSSAGYNMRAVTDVFIWDEQLLRNKRNLWIDSSENVNVINSTLEKSVLALTLDAHIENNSGRGSSVYFLNTTFAAPFVNVEDTDSFLDVKRYLHVRVMRLGVGVDNANVWINDSFGNPDPDISQPLSTGVGNNGWIKWLLVSEFNRTDGNSDITYTPHHIDARDGVTFGLADPTMDASKIITINLDTPPLVGDLSVTGNSVLRTNQINAIANGSDIEDTEELLIPHFEYRDPSEVAWETGYFGAPIYIGSAPTGYWEIPFIPPTTASLGLYDFRIRFEDSSSFFSEWLTLNDTVLVLNNLPYVEQSNNESSSVIRGQTIEIWVDGEDIEEGDDQNFSNANAAEIEYKAFGSLVWESAYLGSEYKDGTDWRATFTPEASPSKALLGLYDFRFRYQDNDLDWSTWFVNNDWIDVLNSQPAFDDLKAQQPDMFRGDSIWILANATDAEDPESSLIVEFYHDEPGGGTVWEQVYLNNLLWDAGGFWKIQFNLPGNAPLGFYNFKIIFTDSDSGYNETIVNGLVNVINSLPVPIDINPSSPTVSKGVGSIFINVNAMDYEDAEDLLTIEVEYQLNNSGNWQSVYIGPQSYAGSPPTGNLRVTFQPDSGATLGFYDIRVRVIDTDLATSQGPEWIYNYNAVEVLSQIYTVDYIEIRDGPDEGGNEVTTMTFGVTDTATFYAAGYNLSGGYVADVDVDWTSDVPSVGSVTSPGPSTLFEAQQVAINSNCNVTATYLGTITDSTGILTILAPTIDGMEIQSASGGAGINLADPGNYPIYPVGHITTFYGALINDSIGYLMDVPASATWESDDTSIVSVTSSGVSSSIMCDNKNWGTVTITLTDSINGFTETTEISVLEPTIDFILITDGPAGGGSNLCDPANYPTFPVGHTTTFYGGYYNLTAGYLQDVPGSSTWDSDNSSIVSVGPTGVSSIIAASNFNVGTVTITIDDGLGLSNTTQITVMDVTIDYVIIRSQPGGLGIDLTDPMNYPEYPVGFSTFFYAAAYNNTQGFIVDITVSWASSDNTTVDVTSPGSSTAISVSDTESETVIISINDGSGHITNTQVTVSPPTVDYIQIRNDILGGGNILFNESYPVGSIDTYYGAQYNHTAGYIGDVPFTATWISSDDNIVSVNSPSSYTTVTISDTNYGTVTITLDDGNGHTNSTQINVIKPTIDFVVIMDSPGGTGSWVGDMIYGITDSDNFYLVAFNHTAGYVEDVSGQLWTSDRTEIGTVNPTSDTSQVTFSAQIVDEEGFCKITVIYGGFTNSTGKLTVLAPTADYIQIRDAANNGGQIVEDISFSANVQIPLYAAAFNMTTGYLGDVDAEWESSDIIIGTMENLTAWTFVSQAIVDSGTCYITATYQGIDNTTGLLTVLALEVDYVVIRDNFDGLGNEVGILTMNQSETIVLYVAGFNLTSGYVKDLENAIWDVTGLLGTFATSGIATTFTAEKAGSGTITVTFNLINNSTQITIMDITQPSKPTKPQEGEITEDGIEISWQTVSDEDIKEYSVERSESSTGPWEEIAKVDKDTTSIKDTDLDSGKTYYYRVVAIDESDNPSEPSDVVTIKTAEPSGFLDDFLWILIILIIVVVVIVLAAVLMKKGKGEPEEIVEDVKFEEMEPIAAAPQRKSRPPPPRRLAQAQKRAQPKPEKTSEEEDTKDPVETKPQEPAKTPPPPPPEEASEVSEKEAKDKKKKAPPFPPPPPPPE